MLSCIYLIDFNLVNFILYVLFNNYPTKNAIGKQLSSFYRIEYVI